MVLDFSFSFLSCAQCLIRLVWSSSKNLSQSNIKLGSGQVKPGMLIIPEQVIQVGVLKLRTLEEPAVYGRSNQIK